MNYELLYGIDIGVIIGCCWNFGTLLPWAFLEWKRKRTPIFASGCAGLTNYERTLEDEVRRLTECVHNANAKWKSIYDRQATADRNEMMNQHVRQMESLIANVWEMQRNPSPRGIPRTLMWRDTQVIPPPDEPLELDAADKAVRGMK